MEAQRLTGLQKAVKKVGGALALADAIGVTKVTVLRWLREDGVSSLAARTYGENAVTQAVDKAGGPVEVARVLGVTHQAVRDYMRKGFMPAPRAQQMELEFGARRAELISPKLRNALGAGGEL